MVGMFYGTSLPGHRIVLGSTLFHICPLLYATSLVLKQPGGNSSGP